MLKWISEYFQNQKLHGIVESLIPSEQFKLIYYDLASIHPANLISFE